jgi:putative hydrolase of the HAD superfamily
MKTYIKPQFQYILFDLDETIYPKESGLMDVIDGRILLFMTQKVGIPADDAPTKKRIYYQQYGTTLRGLIEEHHIDPLEYLHFVYDINPRDFFGPSPPLNYMLQNMPLSKVIFTNADAAHSERVLGALQVRAHFEMIIDIQAINFKSKPDPLAYKRALEILNVSGASCIMVDDKPRNLIPARDLGMTTILVGDDCNSIAIDYTVPTVFHVENILKKLLSNSLAR